MWTSCCAPFTAVHAVAEAVRATNIAVSSQDLFWEKEGAFTGRGVTRHGAQSRGWKCAIVGHSERRVFGDTRRLVRNPQVLAALNADLTPIIICVGGTARRA